MRNLSLLIFLAIIFVSCVNDANNDKNTNNNEADLSDIILKEYSIKPFTDDFHPYNLTYAIPFSWIGTVDQDSIPVFIWDEKPYYHPVYTSLYGIYFVEAFHITGNNRYIELSEKIAAKLVEKSAESNQEFFFPYNFDYHLVNETMIAPWYSGMAQGRMLTFFTRLYKATGEAKYLEWADRTFETFLLLQKDSDNWVSYIDFSNYLWFEEYPTGDPLHVLNGFIYGTYGIYDYYMITKNTDALYLLNAALTTVEHYIPEYRNPGEISNYDLKYKNTKEDYHYAHINQLNALYEISGEIKFKEMADTFKQDFYNKEE
ncbi:MAG: D-glucuronyl C5-epimerase family protein [Balneolaceae bacterium]